MGLASCLIVVQAAGREPLELAARRLAALLKFYAPLGAATALTTEPAQGLMIGEIEFEALGRGRGRGDQAQPPRSDDWVAVWGGPLPPPLRQPAGLFGASDVQLREVRWIGAALGVLDGRALLVTAPVGPTPMYHCDGDLSVWSTHAVAAAWLGTGRVQLEPDALPELVVNGFVSGDRTHLVDTRAVRPAARIEIDRHRVVERDYWPLADRWRAEPEKTAQATGESALLESIRTRLVDAGKPACALTAGRDSRVVALAMRELGIEFSAFTWGAPDAPESAGARHLARAIGVPHQTYNSRWNDDANARAAVDTEVRWSEGLMPTAGFGVPEVPSKPDAIVTGRGGETGRAFFYRLAARAHRRPSHDTLLSEFIAQRPARLAGADPGAHAALRRAVAASITAAADSGHSGWRLLDVVYAERRLTRWDRGTLFRQSTLHVPAFDDPAVQRALVALPLEARLRDGFHRAFIEARAPELQLPPPAGPRRGVPPPLRRSVRRIRARRTARIEEGPSPFAAAWQERPRTRSWIGDELLARPIVREVFGESWVNAVRAGFDRSEPEATKTVLVLAAPLALEQAAAEMPEFARNQRTGQPRNR